MKIRKSQVMNVMQKTATITRRDRDNLFERTGWRDFANVVAGCGIKKVYIGPSINTCPVPFSDHIREILFRYD